MADVDFSFHNAFDLRYRPCASLHLNDRPSRISGRWKNGLKTACFHALGIVVQ